MIEVSIDLDCSEQEFSEWVSQLAAWRRWQLRYHTHDSRRSNPGFPDWVFVHPKGDIVFAELKARKGRVRPEQTRWIEALRQLGLSAYIWRPGDAEEVVQRLWHPRPGCWTSQ